MPGSCLTLNAWPSFQASSQEAIKYEVVDVRRRNKVAMEAGAKANDQHDNYDGSSIP